MGKMKHSSTANGRRNGSIATNGTSSFTQHMMNSRREEGLCTQSQIKPNAEGLMRMSTSAADLSVPVVKWDHSLGRADCDDDEISESKTKSSQCQKPQ
jgi:hypothetical protein